MLIIMHTKIKNMQNKIPYCELEMQEKKKIHVINVYNLILIVKMQN